MSRRVVAGVVTLRRCAIRCAIALGVCFASFASGPALADGTKPPATKAECAKANADGQALRMDGKLAAARERLEMCQSSSCPAIVRDDCAARFDELERMQPTLVFDVKDSTGADLSATAVTVDGAPLQGRIAGGALRVDPGPHDFVVTVAGRPPVTRHLVIKEGEKGRREVVVIGGTIAAAPPATDTVAPAPPAPMLAPEPFQPHSGLGTRKILALGFGGAGVASLVVGSIFGAMTFSAVSQQKSDCASASSCKSPSGALSEHSSSVTDSTISTVAFVAGGALLAGGAVLFFTAPSVGAPTRESSAWLVAPTVGPGRAGAMLEGRF